MKNLFEVEGYLICISCFVELVATNAIKEATKSFWPFELNDAYATLFYLATKAPHQIYPFSLEKCVRNVNFIQIQNSLIIDDFSHLCIYFQYDCDGINYRCIWTFCIINWQQLWVSLKSLLVCPWSKQPSISSFIIYGISVVLMYLLIKTTHLFSVHSTKVIKKSYEMTNFSHIYIYSIALEELVRTLLDNQKCKADMYVERKINSSRVIISTDTPRHASCFTKWNILSSFVWPSVDNISSMLWNYLGSEKRRRKQHCWHLRRKYW